MADTGNLAAAAAGIAGTAVGGLLAHGEHQLAVQAVIVFGGAMWGALVALAEDPKSSVRIGLFDRESMLRTFVRCSLGCVFSLIGAAMLGKWFGLDVLRAGGIAAFAVAWKGEKIALAALRRYSGGGR
jgi:hypothetical protein